MESTLQTIGNYAQRQTRPDSEERISQVTSPSIKSDSYSGRSFSNILTTVLSWNFAGIVLALLFEATFQSPRTPGRIARDFVDSFVYANCIGILVGFAVLGFTPRLVRRRFPINWVLLVSLVLSLTFVGSLAAGLILMGLGIFPPHDFAWISLRRMGLGFLIATVFGVSGYLYESVHLRLKATTQRLRRKEWEEERAQKLAVEASLSSLQSRIQPHFLFNTLNSISALIQEDPLVAERMVERLAALLRFALDSTERSTIPLEQELKIATDYLEIEKARFGERLCYEIDAAPHLNTFPVPPFVIQTLVENSVKHAVSVRRQGGKLYLKIAESDNKVNIEVGDDGSGFTEDVITMGHGLDNLRARLVALYQGEAALEVSEERNFTVVKVSLPNQTRREAR